MSHPKRRLDQLARTLSTVATPIIGTLRLGNISYDVPHSENPSRLPFCKDLLDVQNPVNQDNLHFMLQKYLLGQDIFLVSQPGPYARRLAMTFCSLINSEYEHIALHRDVGETELKQGREIRAMGNLVYVDSAAVRAVKSGRVLILEGIEKAERGIMPVLNNLLENREMNLDDGTHILHSARYDTLESRDASKPGQRFVPAHRNFRVIAIAAPVPPYPGHPLDPPFRSRFQARFIDPVGASLALESNVPANIDIPQAKQFADKLRDIILSAQYASETRQPLAADVHATLSAFPQTALMKLKQLVTAFPPDVSNLSPKQLARTLLALHPALLYAPTASWAILSRQCEEAGLGPLGDPKGINFDDGSGLLGYSLLNIERIDNSTAHISFALAGADRSMSRVDLNVPAGPKSFLPFSFSLGNPNNMCTGPTFTPTPRLLSTLTALFQAHALGWDVSLVPPAQSATASCSTSIIVRLFGELLGYETDDVHLYKEVGGRELLMRRHIEDGGATSWQPSALVQGAWAGKLIHLSGIDVIGATAGSLSRLTQDRETELWEGQRMVAANGESETSTQGLSTARPSFRMITTVSKSIPLRDWLTAEHVNMFFPVLLQPMGTAEESALLHATGCPHAVVNKLVAFAEKYRASMAAEEMHSAGNTTKNRKLGTRTLVRMARRIAAAPWDDDLYEMIRRAVLADFLPAAEKMVLGELLSEAGIMKRFASYNAPPILTDRALTFSSNSNGTDNGNHSVEIPRFNPAQDLEGVASHVPHMEHFFDNSLQAGLMRDMAIDLELLGEHLVLLGNQGVGKNKIIDRLCQLLGRPREYVQLHRDTTVNQLMFTTTLAGGVLRHDDSPLLRGITFGRVVVVDEADKAPAHVVAVLRSLGSHGALTLADGRRVRPGPDKERTDDIVVHPNFRLILLANRPGYPFLGNHFLQVLGDNFSSHSVQNPDTASERRLLQQLAPEVSEDTLRRLVGAFQDLRRANEAGKLSYPYSLRELINIVRHMRAYPEDSLEDTLRNVFDFDVHRPEAIDFLYDVLQHHGLKVKHLGIDAAREATKKQTKDIKFEPSGSTELKEPKFGKEDEKNEEHSGGNTWAGGTGGRDTAGLGGRGGYMRLFKGHDIKQVSDELKKDVPDSVKEKAREMARQELERRLKELNMSVGEAKEYNNLLTEVREHIAELFDLLENLSAREEERVWVKRQTDGELDDSRLTEGLTGEATVYKRRGTEKPELGRPQIKPKRIRFVFDVSGSMYRFQYDGRLQRSLETAAMLMETFGRLTRRDKYVWDMSGHSGDSPTIPLVDAGSPPAEVRDRWKVVEKMSMITQYAFAGDYTVEAIEKAVDEVAKFDADDWFVIAISDANFSRYQITAEDLKRAMNRNPKVRTALICIGEGAEAAWIPKHFRGRGFRVANTHDIPKVLRSILSSMIDS